MAGKDHHFVWRLIQKGFSFRHFNADHIWVYETGGKVRQTETKKYGQQRFFYGPENSQADLNITAFENRYAELIHFVRDAPDGAQLDAKQVAPYLAHLEMRGILLRAEGTRVLSEMMRRLEEVLSNENATEALMIGYYRAHPEEMKKMLADNGIPTHQLDDILDLVSVALPGLIRGAATNLLDTGASEIGKFRSQIGRMVADAQNKALTEDFSEVERANNHLGFDFVVRQTDSESIILPDTMVAFLMKKGATPISAKTQKTQQIVIPVSSGKMIVGLTSAPELRNVKSINKILAACSLESFVYKEKTDYHSRLTSRIGKFAKMMSKRELEQAFTVESLFGV